MSNSSGESAQLRENENASAAACPYFGRCGGCSSQHVPYDAQLLNKRAQLRNAVGTDEIEVFSGEPFHYRNRVDMVFHEKGIGFREKGKWHKVVDIEQCLISNTAINKLITEVRESFNGIDAFDLKKRNGTYRYAVIRTPRGSSSISMVLNPESSGLQAALEKIERFAATSSAENVIVSYVRPNSSVSISDEYFVVKGSDALHETFLAKRFSFSLQGFFQVNSDLAERMHEYVRGILSRYETKSAHLLDLYGGVGTFGIINADLFQKVTMIESFAGCVDSMGTNLAANGVTNAEPMLLDAKYLKRLEFPAPLFVINDPPRSGMHPKTIENLRDRKPDVIIYVSCNLQQLGADLKKLEGYTVKSAALFDFFPHTPHAEGIVELVRSF